MGLKEQIEVILEPYLAEGDCFVVDIQIKPSRSGQKVSILLDSDEGIGIDECVKISRRLGNELEEKELISEAYTLEVSSPGLDQPLRLLRQYKKNVGRTLKITLLTGEVVTGTLVEVKEESVVLQLPKPKKKTKEPLDEAALLPEIGFAAISKAIVQVSFTGI
jgi:ribosome maturation factor RimP